MEFLQRLGNWGLVLGFYAHLDATTTFTTRRGALDIMLVIRKQFHTAMFFHKTLVELVGWCRIAIAMPDI